MLEEGEGGREGGVREIDLHENQLGLHVDVNQSLNAQDALRPIPGSSAVLE